MQKNLNQRFFFLICLFVTKKLHLFVKTRFNMFAMPIMSLLTFVAVFPLKIEKYFSILKRRSSGKCEFWCLHRNEYKTTNSDVSGNPCGFGLPIVRIFSYPCGNLQIHHFTLALQICSFAQSTRQPSGTFKFIGISSKHALQLMAMELIHCHYFYAVSPLKIEKYFSIL